MDENAVSVPHTLYIDNRNKLSLTGVTDVGSFSDSAVQISTSLGDLSVSGENLQITRLSLENGELTVEGLIVSVVYSQSVKRGGGFFARVFS